MRASTSLRHHSFPSVCRIVVAVAVVLAVLTLTGFVVLAQRPVAATARPAALDTLARQFAAPPPDARIMMRWWWFGPAVTNDGIDRELRAMRDGGIGGVEVQPLYPVTLDDSALGIRNLPYLSNEFLAAVRYTAERTRDLGMRLDLTVGSGWPFGGPSVSVDDAAGKLRVERVPIAAGATRAAVPDVGAGERLIAAFLVEGSASRELTEIRDRVVSIPAAHQAATALFFISSRSGMMVKRPSVDADGFVVNHYDEAATRRYLARVGDPLLEAARPVTPFAVFCDSLEVYESDWTSDFLAEFQRRRGYDLRPHLAALAIAGPDSAAVRHDWGQTLSDLLDDRFLTTVQNWATTKGTQLRVQGYGIPPATIWSNSIPQLPEGEGVQWKGVSATRWAASAAHLFNRPVVSSETWTWLHSPSFRATPLDLKAEANIHFLQGVTQLIGHGWPYSPAQVAYPGWRMYAAGAFNDKNPWWTVMPDLAAYLQRTSFILRQGTPANDVAFYLPIDDAWAAFEPGKVGSLMEALQQCVGTTIVGSIVDAGFNLDFVDAHVVQARAKVDGKTLVIGSNRYKAVVLPAIDRIPLDVLQTLEAFAKAGGVVIASKHAPEHTPGFVDRDKKDREVQATVTRLFDSNGASAVVVPDERQVGATLAGRLTPDARFSSGASDLGVVHRHLDQAELYFVANTSNASIRTTATFRTTRPAAQAWDPMNGTSISIESRVSGDGVSVDLDLPAYASTVVALTDGRPLSPTRRASAAIGKTSDPIDISKGWRVTFRDVAPSAPPTAAATFDALRSWADRDESKFFSGVGVYERQMEIPAAMAAKGRRVVLDFGAPTPLTPQAPPARFQAWVAAPVRDAAVVFVNGTRVGTVWCPPYVIDITDAVVAGANAIRVEVANTAINYMAGHALPDYKLLNRRYGTRFEPQDMDKVQPLPSGLVGTVTVRARDK